MRQAAFVQNRLNAFTSKLRRWRYDNRGLAAIEFAFVMPFLLILYMGAAEISHVLTLDRKVTAIASATSDLVAQEKNIDNAKMLDIFQAATSMIIPYSETPISLVVTAIEADPNNGNTTVKWSDAHNGAAKTPGTAITVPAGLVEPGGFVILTEISYVYDPIIGEVIQSGFTLEDQFYVKPRRTSSVIRD